ncbi:MAG TPA: response regulator transcription factor [Actinomycetales bacterium]|nr:response regulator transcription factor [Actinomycetales bacterium]
MTIRVVIVDDEALVRSGIRLIVEAADGIEVVGEAADGASAVAMARDRRPDVTLLDVHMPAMNGLEAASHILQGAEGVGRVLMLTTFDRDEYVYEAMKLGASGFLLKSAPPEELVEGIRRAAVGETPLAPAVTRRLIEEFVRRPPPGQVAAPIQQALTDRETEVLKLIATGLSNADIARRLFLSEGTVKTHVNRIFAKLGLRDRAQAVVLAYESGLVRAGGQGDDKGS